MLSKWETLACMVGTAALAATTGFAVGGQYAWERFVRYCGV